MTETEKAEVDGRGSPIGGRLVGSSPRRKDSPEALTGKATYTGDIHFPAMLYAAIYRSPYAHARIRSVDLSRALASPGVVAALSGDDLPNFVNPIQASGEYRLERSGSTIVRMHPPIHSLLAVDKVRFVGEPVAVVVASDPYRAEDALELIDADFEMLRAVVDAEEAMKKESPLVYEDLGENVLLYAFVSGGDVEKAFRKAPHVFKETIKSSRFTGTPIEPRAVVARYDPGTHLLEVWATTQNVHLQEEQIQQTIALPGLKVRVIVSRLGGAFGQKGYGHQENTLIPLLAYLVKKPVKWVETRSEHMVGTNHAREQVHHLEVAVENDGTILGLKDRIVADMGSGYLNSGFSTVRVSSLFVTGVYRIQNYEGQIFGVATNKTCYGPHRGFGKAEPAYVIERLIDIVARKLRLDPIEIRRRNFIRPEEFPYQNATGSRYDSGDYEKILDKALKLADYPHWRKEQEKARKEGRWIGIGIAVVVEPTSTHRGGVGSYYGVRMRVEPSGNVWVFICGNDDGTGHDTVVSQIVADELGFPFENVNTVEGDSLLCPYGSGSHSSRFAVVGTSAVMLAARKLKEKILAIASALLKVDYNSLAIKAGKIRVATDSREISIQDVARVAYSTVHRLPPGMEPGLEILYHYRDPNVSPNVDERGRVAQYSTFPYAADVAVVEVDPGTGKVHIHKYVSVHDCGNMINPSEVAGQHMGALAHGIGGALYEELLYDETGQPLVQNFKDYLVPTAVEVPHVELGHTITPAPFTPGGFKGAGETGTVSPPPCLANAVEDALRPLGVEIRTLPLKPNFVWEMLRSAQIRTDTGRLGSEAG